MTKRLAICKAETPLRIEHWLVRAHTDFRPDLSKGRARLSCGDTSLDAADLDVTITGFEIPEIDSIIADVDGKGELEPPVPEPDLNVPAVTDPGDVWILDKLGSSAATVYTKARSEPDGFEACVNRVHRSSFQCEDRWSRHR